MDLYTQTLFAIKQNKKEDHCNQKLSAKCSLFCPLSRNWTFQSQVVRDQKAGREGISAVCCICLFCFYFLQTWLSKPEWIIYCWETLQLEAAKPLCMGQQVHVRHPDTFQNNLFRKLWGKTLLVNTNIYLNYMLLMTLTSHLNKQSKCLIYIY